MHGLTGASTIVVPVMALWMSIGLARPSTGQLPRGENQPSSTSGSVQPQRLDQLDRQLLEGLAPSGPVSTPPVRPIPSNAANQPAAGGADQNPLSRISEQMRVVQGRLSKRDTSPQTQAIQKQILDDLAALFKEGRNQQASLGQPGRATPGAAQVGAGTGEPTSSTTPDAASRPGGGPQMPAQHADVKALISRVWGHLPETVRGQMRAPFSEQFLPKYERLIEDYYRRLAEDGAAAP
jgi:hypothetical protein